MADSVGLLLLETIHTIRGYLHTYKGRGILHYFLVLVTTRERRNIVPGYPDSHVNGLCSVVICKVIEMLISTVFYWLHVILY